MGVRAERLGADQMTDVLQHMLYRTLNARMKMWPFPHFTVDNVVPENFYRTTLNNLPNQDDYRSISEIRDVKAPKSSKKAYKDRYVVPLTHPGLQLIRPAKRDHWTELKNIIKSEQFCQALIHRFTPLLKDKLEPDEQLIPDLLLIRDKTGYKIHPHTDHPMRVLVWIMYLAPDDTKPHLGTSLYVPKADQPQQCDGGPHHPRERFHRVFTAPYKPNTALCFLKGGNSFHGVERITTPGEERNILHFFLRRQTPDEK
jgi:hypothetical protein